MCEFELGRLFQAFRRKQKSLTLASLWLHFLWFSVWRTPSRSVVFTTNLWREITPHLEHPQTPVMFGLKERQLCRSESAKHAAKQVYLISGSSVAPRRCLQIASQERDPAFLPINTKDGDPQSEPCRRGWPRTEKKSFSRDILLVSFSGMN
jgi:hypothetical protein